MTLRERIEREIRERGPIPFSRYMEMCLYEPELGYYARTPGAVRQGRRLSTHRATCTQFSDG